MSAPTRGGIAGVLVIHGRRLLDVFHGQSARGGDSASLTLVDMRTSNE